MTDLPSQAPTAPPPLPSDLASLAERFAVPPPVTVLGRFGNGLINDTFLVRAADGDYILQRINNRVFPRPERIMSNLAVLTEHLVRRAPKDLHIPHLVNARNGIPFLHDESHSIWRLMELIPNAAPLAQVQTAQQAREIGRVLGRFHHLVHDLDPKRLCVSLPGFHVTPRHLRHYVYALQAFPPANHTPETRWCIELIDHRRNLVRVLETARRESRIALHVTHGDPKLDNILFDRTTGRAVSLIDLDTVQPGLIEHDIGDCLRSCCNRIGEDGTGRCSFDLDTCREVLGAYAEETSGLLEDTDIELLFDAIRLIPFELGLRFLTDHLEGDRYFRVQTRGDNLRRALVQFRLVQDIEAKEPEILGIIAGSFTAPYPMRYGP